MYIFNIEGEKRYRYVKNEFFRTIVIPPIIYSFILYLCYLSIATKIIVVFYLILVATIIYYIVFGIYAPIRLMKRQNRTISEIVFLNNEVIIETRSVHWLKPRKIKVFISDLFVKTRKFGWYGNAEKEGLSIINNDIEYFLVKDYFDEYESIKTQILLSKNSTQQIVS